MYYTVAVWSAVSFLVFASAFIAYLEIYYRVTKTYIYMLGPLKSTVIPLAFLMTSFGSACVSIVCSVLHYLNN